MIPARGLVYCKPVQTAVTFAGGVIELLEDTRERWVSQQCEIVSVGPLAVCEDAECDRAHDMQHHPFGAQAGDWVLVAPRQFTEVEDGLWALPQDAVMAILQP